MKTRVISLLFPAASPRFSGYSVNSLVIYLPLYNPSPNLLIDMMPVFKVHLSCLFISMVRVSRSSLLASVPPALMGVGRKKPHLFQICFFLRQASGDFSYTQIQFASLILKVISFSYNPSLGCTWPGVSHCLHSCAHIKNGQPSISCCVCLTTLQNPHSHREMLDGRKNLK